MPLTSLSPVLSPVPVDLTWKPILSALLQPPASVLVLLLIGLWLLRREHRRAGTLLILGSTVALWLMCCVGTAKWLQDTVLRPPPALNAQQLRSLVRTPNQTPTAIVVLGAGRHRHAAEYGTGNLTQQAMVRLRYGMWLSRRTGQPVAYSGGVGWAQNGEDSSEADIAARIAQDDYSTSLRWTENQSRDTRENAQHMSTLLEGSGIRRIVLVTHASHMARSVRAFREAAPNMSIVPAPVAAVSLDDDKTVLNWLPSSQGFWLVHNALHEIMGLIAGA